jgi:hypothetical protein
VKIKSITLVFLSLLIISCQERGHNTLSYKQVMKEEIQKAEKQNQEYIPFTSDSVLKIVVDYYDHYGNSQEKMKAHYLLGCAYEKITIFAAQEAASHQQYY